VRTAIPASLWAVARFEYVGDADPLDGASGGILGAISETYGSGHDLDSDAFGRPLV
jgi:hypothetical protein